jgi:phosphatidylglycerol:prolipoprotein diacylglycerol transferase
MSLFQFIPWNVSPDIIDLGFFPLRWYSVFFAIGFILSYQILQRYFRTEDVKPHVLENLTIYIVVATVVGARLGHCFFYEFDYYSHHLLEVFLPIKIHPKLEFVGYQGLASHGGAIGILVALIIFTKKYKVSLSWILDRLALVIPLAGCCIRLGNLFNSEIIGRPSNVPWAFIFERVDNLPRHPGQLYEAILYVLIFVFLNWLYHQTPRQSGYIFGAFLVLLFSARFLVEFSKEPQSDFESTIVLNMGQLLSIPFIFFGLLIVLRNGKTRLITNSPKYRS